MNAQKNITIHAGPSREELFDALRLRHESRLVEFTVTDRKDKMRAVIDSIGVESGDGESWILEVSYRGVRLEGYYHSKRREGVFRQKLAA
jgi:hypothetical protein